MNNTNIGTKDVVLRMLACLFFTCLSAQAEENAITHHKTIYAEIGNCGSFSRYGRTPDRLDSYNGSWHALLQSGVNAEYKDNNLFFNSVAGMVFQLPEEHVKEPPLKAVLYLNQEKTFAPLPWDNSLDFAAETFDPLATNKLSIDTGPNDFPPERSSPFGIILPAASVGKAGEYSLDVTTVVMDTLRRGKNAIGFRIVPEKQAFPKITQPNFVFFTCLEGDFNNPRLVLELSGKSAQEMLALYSFKTKTEPVIDGELDDLCWKDAQQAVDFIVLTKTNKSAVGSAVMSAYDNNCLYFAAKLAEPEPVKLKVDPLAAWNGDCVEFFVDVAHNHNDILQIAVDSEGKTMMTRYHNGAQSLTTEKLKVTAKAKKDPDCWSIELAVPFAELGIKPPVNREKWGVNFGRYRHAAKEYSSWAYLKQTDEGASYGHLIFSTEGEIVPDIAYWKDRDPRLTRKFASGFDVLRHTDIKKNPVKDIWEYDPYLAETWDHNKLSSKLRLVRLQHPFFFEAAKQLNECMLEKARLDNRLSDCRRAFFYLASGRDAPPALAMKIGQYETGLQSLEQDLNKIYRLYTTAYASKLNSAALRSFNEDAAEFRRQVNNAGTDLKALLGEIQGSMRQIHGDWRKIDYAFSIPAREDKPFFNGKGQARRYFFGVANGYGDILGSANLGQAIDEIQDFSGGFQMAYSTNAFLVSPENYAAYVSTFKEKYIPDGYPEKYIIHFASIISRSKWFNEHYPEYVVGQQVDYCNPQAMALLKAYWKDAANMVKSNQNLFYITTFQENCHAPAIYCSPYARPAFQDWLKETYTRVEDLNRAWRTNYADFARIDLPSAKPDRTGLSQGLSPASYDFYRFVRRSYLRMQKSAYDCIKAVSPGSAVCIDASNENLYDDLYEAFSCGPADIFSHHSNIFYEDAFNVYLNSINRRYQKSLGLYEYYSGYRLIPYFKDEVKSRRALMQFLFRQAMWNKRTICCWQYVSHDKYLIAYNLNMFNPVWDNSTLRYYTGGYPGFINRFRLVEKAILESEIVRPQIGVVTPTATIVNLESILDFKAVYNAYSGFDSLTEMMQVYHELLTPRNYNFDYLAEQAVINGVYDLADYKVLILPYCIFLPEKLSARLEKWTGAGGKLIAVGPFGVFDEYAFQDMKFFNKWCGADLQPQLEQFVKEGLWGLSVPGALKYDNLECLRKPFGKGEIFYLNRPLGKVMKNPEIKRELYGLLAESTPRFVSADTEELELMTRQDKKDNYYVCVLNRNVEKAVTGRINIMAEFKQVVDITLPEGGILIPSETRAGKTCFDLRLDPGEFTVIRLGEKSLKSRWSSFIQKYLR